MSRLNKIISGIGKAVASLALIGLVSCAPKPKPYTDSFMDYGFESRTADMELITATRASLGLDLLVRTSKGFYRFTTDRHISGDQWLEELIHSCKIADKDKDKFVTDKEAREFLVNTYDNVAKSYLEAFLEKNKLKSLDSLSFDRFPDY